MPSFVGLFRSNVLSRLVVAFADRETWTGFFAELSSRQASAARPRISLAIAYPAVPDEPPAGGIPLRPAAHRLGRTYPDARRRPFIALVDDSGFLLVSSVHRSHEHWRPGGYTRLSADQGLRNSQPE